MAILKIKRNTTNSTVPTGLSNGELAYVQQTNKLYIGKEISNDLWQHTQLQVQSTDSDSGTTINFTKGASGSAALNTTGGSPYGGITHDTSQSKFGSSSLYFNNGFLSTTSMPISGYGNDGSGWSSQG